MEDCKNPLGDHYKDIEAKLVRKTAERTIGASADRAAALRKNLAAKELEVAKLFGECEQLADQYEGMVKEKSVDKISKEEPKVEDFVSGDEVSDYHVGDESPTKIKVNSSSRVPALGKPRVKDWNEKVQEWIKKKNMNDDEAIPKRHAFKLGDVQFFNHFFNNVSNIQTQLHENCC